MRVLLQLSDGRVVEITSDEGKYNKDTYDLFINMENEIKEVLTQMDLRLGMEIEDWPPENIEELARKIQDPY